jgi:hypothetical protein
MVKGSTSKFYDCLFSSLPPAYLLSFHPIYVLSAPLLIQLLSLCHILLEDAAMVPTPVTILTN